MNEAAKEPAGFPGFTLGAVVMTCGVDELMHTHGLEPIQYLQRHARGDWGELEEEDLATNGDALINGGRLFSAYNLTGLPVSRLWIITEADRSVTTLLLPSEY